MKTEIFCTCGSNNWGTVEDRCVQCCETICKHRILFPSIQHLAWLPQRRPPGKQKCGKNSKNINLCRYFKFNREDNCNTSIKTFICPMCTATLCNYMLHCSLLWTSCLRFLTKSPVIPQQLYKTASHGLSWIAELLVFFCRWWSDLDKILRTGAEWHVDCGDVVKIETRCRIPIWWTFGGNSMACHPRATCHNATWRIRCHDSRATCHIARCCHLVNSLSRFQSHMPHCRVQSPGEINVVIVSHCRV